LGLHMVILLSKVSLYCGHTAFWRLNPHRRKQRDHKFGIWISVFRRLCWFSLPLICRLHSGSTSENVVAYAGGAQCLQSAMGPKTCWPPYSPRRLHFYAASSLRGEHETGLQNSNAFIKTTHICSSMDIDFLIFIPAPFPTIYAT
jgi:hypothetical protein